jgi:hypothetical protein
MPVEKYSTKLRMDTRFWGPSGWRLLHLIAFTAKQLPKQKLYTFFETLPYVLPCKFCRASLTDYYAVDPIPQKPEDYAHWLYRIHNRVNGKLREQKLLETQDPAWTDVKRQYTKWMTTPCTSRMMMGWDFLYSVAYTTPCPEVSSSPMPGAPPIQSLKSPELRNRWNVLSNRERLLFLETWWVILPYVLPFAPWRNAWQSHVRSKPVLSKGRTKTTEWLYSAEQTMCKALKDDLPRESFQGLCSELSAFSSGCGAIKSPKVKTCRAKRSKLRSTIRKKRETRFSQTGGFL